MAVLDPEPACVTNAAGAGSADGSPHVLSPARQRRQRWIGLIMIAVVLLLVSAASLLWGVRSISFGTVADALTHREPGNNDHSVVLDQRVPRTILGLVAGAALGLVGVHMQGLTRNPIADPGLLGINGGASLAVILAINVFDITTPSGFVWFAFLGAAVAALVVYGGASLGWEGVTPVKLALVGAAFAAIAVSLVTLVLLSDRRTLQDFRYWQVGSLVARPLQTVVTLLPFLIVGVVLALVSGRTLNVLALGDDLARGLGQGLVVGRLTSITAIVLLAGCATAFAGPIAFVGLVVPHIARAIVGPDYRWILPYAALLGAILLVLADIVGRLIARPTEVEAGIVVAVIGAPVMIWLIRRAKAVSV